MTRVLVTGACGNIGALTVDLLEQRGYHVHALDLGSPAQRKRAQGWGERVTCFWGDVCDEALVARAVRDVDHVLHLAAIIPPFTDVDQYTAHRVNVGGTRTLLRAAEAEAKRPRFTFTSTAAVWGDNTDDKPPRRGDEPVVPCDNYARQKVLCEAMLAASPLDTVVFRLAVTPPLSAGAISPFIFEFHPDTRVEFTHPRDLALALANSLFADALVGKVWGLGGGAAGRTTYREWLNEALGALGIAPLPREAFGPHRFYTDWLDSESTQAILDYQRHSYADYLVEIRASLGAAGKIAPLFGGVARRYALLSSPHYAEAHGKQPWLPALTEKAAFWTKAAGLGRIVLRGLAR